MVLNDTIDQRDFHPQTAEYTFFSGIHGTFYRTDHMPGHKTCLNKFKRIEIILSIFFNLNTIKLEINNLKNWKKNNYVETKQHAIKKTGGWWWWCDELGDWD